MIVIPKHCKKCKIENNTNGEIFKLLRDIISNDKLKIINNDKDKQTQHYCKR
jgi:hypothetical protein